MTSSSGRRAGVVQGSEPTATGPEPSSGVGPAFHLGEPEPPLRSYLELGALPTAVPCARLHARHVLREWRLNGPAQDSELLVSELVTNAVKGTAGRAEAAVRLRRWSGASCGLYCPRGTEWGRGGNHRSFGRIDQRTPCPALLPPVTVG